MLCRAFAFVGTAILLGCGSREAVSQSSGNGQDSGVDAGSVISDSDAGPGQSGADGGTTAGGDGGSDAGTVAGGDAGFKPRDPTTAVAMPQSVASSRICRVTVPRTASAWPGWSELAATASDQFAAAVDTDGAIYLGEWNGGFEVRRETASGWQSFPRLLVTSYFWAFTVARGHPILARTFAGPVTSPDQYWPWDVEVQRLGDGGWERLGAAFEAIPHIDPIGAQTAGKPALVADSLGRVLLMFDSEKGPSYGQAAYRWDGAWTAIGSPGIVNVSYGGYSSAIIPGAGDRAWMMSSWANRTNANLGCYDTGVHVASFDGTAWTGLGEMKRIRGLSEDTGCPLSDLSSASLAVGDDGNPLIAFDEDGHVYLDRWTGLAWALDSDWPGATGRYGSVTLSAVANGGLWLTWVDLERPDLKVVVQRKQATAWETVDELRSASRGAVLCVDEAGNPVMTVTDAKGGHLLYRQP